MLLFHEETFILWKLEIFWCLYQKACGRVILCCLKTPEQFYSLSQLESLATEQSIPRASQKLAKGVFDDACSFSKDLKKVQISANV